MTFTFEASVASNGNTLAFKNNAWTFNGKPVALDGKTCLSFRRQRPRNQVRYVDPHEMESLSVLT